MRRHALMLVAYGLVFLISTAGCGGGGGGGGGGSQSPPPQPDFAISLSSSSITLIDGTTSSPITVAVTPTGSFTGSVNIALNGIPAGVTANPSGTFSVAAGQSVGVIFGASSSASTGQFNITAAGASGSLSHFSNLSLTVQAGVPTNLPRTSYLRNDSVASLDNPAGELHRRHIIYDPARQQLFVANNAMNRVEVYSTSTFTRIATIDVPGASSVELSPDGSILWVGTTLEQFVSIDPAALQVKSRTPVPGLTPIPNQLFIRPVELLSLSSGKLLVRLRQPSSNESLAALWDPLSSSFTNLTSLAPALFQNGFGVVARSANQRRFLVCANDSSATAATFDSNGNLLSGPQSLGTGTIISAAANSDGSQLAILLASNNATQLLLLNSGLSIVGTYNATSSLGVLFSPDGQTLYVAEAFGGGRVITALTAATMQPIGQAPDLSIQGVGSSLEDIDTNNFLYAVANRGITRIDVAQTFALSPNAPLLANAPALQPSEGVNVGGTTVTLNGSNFSASAQVRFGNQNAVNAQSLSATQLQLASPPSATSGPSDVTAYFSNNWLAFAPAAFSYGPSMQSILPNAVSPSGGDTVVLYGYGFGSDPTQIKITIGGQPATVQKVEALSNILPTSALDAAYPFSLERVTLTSPAGSPGKADIAITTPSGSTTLPKSFQYLTSSQIFSHPGLYKFILYDQPRQQLYVTATDHVDAFHLSTQVFGTPIGPPPNGPPPDAALRGLALTPDGSQLIVADFGAQSVYLINPDGGANNGAKVPVGGVSGFLNSGPARVSATSTETVFVGLSGEGTNSGVCNFCLGQMNLSAGPPAFEPAPQPEVATLTGAPLLQTDATGSTMFLAYSSSPGGPVASWSANSPDAFTLSTANDLASDLTASPDGTMLAMRSNNATEIRNSALSLVATPAQAELERVLNRTFAPGIAMHPTGALLYEPFLDGTAPPAQPAKGIRGGIDIRDANNGALRLRIYLPEPLAMLSTDVDGLHGGFLTVDENGQRLFAVTTSGLTVIQLANVPLGIGTLSQTLGPATGGTVVTLRGSGFQSATKATLGGKSAAVSYKDVNTISLTTPAMNPGPQQLVLINPDGESVSQDAAYTAQ
jgi:DNA-binding beta-propeller fold protein YncE